MTPFRLALVNLSRRHFTSFVALAALSLPVAAGGALHRLHTASEARFASLDATPGVIVAAKAGELDILLNSLNGQGSYPAPLTYNLYDSLRSRFSASQPSDDLDRHEVLEHMFPVILFGKYEGMRLVGTDHHFWQRPPSVESLSLQSGRWPTTVGEIVVGSEAARRARLSAEMTISVQPWITDDESINDQLPPFRVTIVGVMNHTGTFWDKQLYATVDQAHQTISHAAGFGLLHPVWRHNIVHFIIGYEGDEGFAPVTQLVNNATVAQAVAVDEQVSRLHELTGARQKIGLLISVLALALGALAVTGIMMTRFDYMRPQLNVLRALGYRRRELAGWLLWEGALLGLTAILMGALIDLAAFPLIRQLAEIDEPTAASVSLWVSFPVWAAAFAAALLAALIPLCRLYRQSVHQSLRQL